MSFNQVTAIGNLGRDPELRYTPQGKAVCNFSIAVNEKQRDKEGEYQDVTTWFRCTAWDKTAENAGKYLAKGDQVFVQGRLKVDEWNDRDGNNRYTLEIIIGQMTFLNNQGKDKDQSNESYGRDSARQQQQEQPQQQAEPEREQDVPLDSDGEAIPDWAR